MRSLVVLTAAVAVVAQVPVSLDQTADGIQLSNGYALLYLNLNRGSVDILQGRFEGDGNFATSPNLSPVTAYDLGSVSPSTPAGALSVVVIGNGASLGETSTSSMPIVAVPKIITNTPAAASFSVTLQDGAKNQPARIQSTITFSLTQQSRSFVVNVSTTTLPTANVSATAVTLRMWFSPQSSMIAYSTGARQGSQATSPFLASQVPWQTFYGIGRGGCVDIKAADAATSSMGTIMFAGVWNGARSGVELVLAGRVPDAGWRDGLEYVGNTVALGPNAALATANFILTPNNYDFPASVVPTSGPQTAMDVNDLRSVLIGPISSSVGALHSYDYSPETRIAPCISINGGNCYGGMFNFFDPDSFQSVSSMLYTYEPATVAAARGLVETNLHFICPGNISGQKCEQGQMMHHFVENCNGGDPWCWCTSALPTFEAGEVGYEAQSVLQSLKSSGINATNRGNTACVTYEAISGAVQTGPNIFHLWASLRVAAVTGDQAWLSTHMPQFRESLEFLLRRLDTSINLFLVPGSLMIDTFIRTNYTLDTNAAMVLLLEKVADAEASLGNTTGASTLLSLAQAVRTAIPKYLLAPSGDHFCTQANPSASGTIPCARDFVDYDANLLAIAAGVATSTAQAESILARIDSGPCAHQHATWVSEKFYDSNNCFDGNTGDSAISMGRISWLDALARRVVDSSDSNAMLTDVILAPMQAELLSNTWMYERYQCQAKGTHNPYYIEMPEIVNMVLVEGKYGLDLTSFTTVTVNPVDSLDVFTFAPAQGSAVIQYDRQQGTFMASLPTVTAGTRVFTVTRLPEGNYTVTTTGSGGGQPTTVPVGADGVLTFSAPVGVGVSVSAVKQ